MRTGPAKAQIRSGQAPEDPPQSKMKSLGWQKHGSHETTRHWGLERIKQSGMRAKK